MLVDTIMQVEAGAYYTVAAMGYSRAGMTPAKRLGVIQDSPPAITGDNVAIRVVHFGSGLGRSTHSSSPPAAARPDLGDGTTTPSWFRSESRRRARFDRNVLAGRKSMSDLASRHATNGKEAVRTCLENWITWQTNPGRAPSSGRRVLWRAAYGSSPPPLVRENRR